MTHPTRTCSCGHTYRVLKGFLGATHVCPGCVARKTASMDRRTFEEWIRTYAPKEDRDAH